MAENNLAGALVRLGRLDEAIEHYDKALTIRPDYAEAHANLGLTLLRRGRNGEAIEHFRKALVLARQQNKPSLVDNVNAWLRPLEAGSSR